jgi:subtilisin family serine protease
VGSDGQRLAYSSCGDQALLPKPDLVAPVPFPSMWRTRPFTGTSAAAPQAAGLAALLWARQRQGTADLVRQALTAAARRTAGGSPHSLETGFGRIHLP